MLMSSSFARSTVATLISMSCANVFRDGHAWPFLLAYLLRMANSRTALAEMFARITYSGTIAK
jgi:hypothetical protein